MTRKQRPGVRGRLAAERRAGAPLPRGQYILFTFTDAVLAMLNISRPRTACGCSGWFCCVSAFTVPSRYVCVGVNSPCLEPTANLNLWFVWLTGGGVNKLFRRRGQGVITGLAARKAALLKGVSPLNRPVLNRANLNKHSTNRAPTKRPALLQVPQPQYFAHDRNIFGCPPSSLWVCRPHFSVCV